MPSLLASDMLYPLPYVDGNIVRVDVVDAPVELLLLLNLVSKILLMQCLHRVHEWNKASCCSSSIRLVIGSWCSDHRYFFIALRVCALGVSVFSVTGHGNGIDNESTIS